VSAETVLLKTVRALNRAGVRYALAGGFAFSIRAVPRSTVDIDFLILTPEDKESLIQALKKEYKTLIVHDKPMAAGAFEIFRLVAVDEYETIIDLLSPGPAEFIRSALYRADKIPFQGEDIPVLTIDDIYVMKKGSCRHQDIHDCEVIETIMMDGLDMDYIKKWSLY
jgi:pyruvate/2-oxoglutarate/acetoin dehydrogenase E1 component